MQIFFPPYETVVAVDIRFLFLTICSPRLPTWLPFLLCTQWIMHFKPEKGYLTMPLEQPWAGVAGITAAFPQWHLSWILVKKELAKVGALGRELHGQSAEVSQCLLDYGHPALLSIYEAEGWQNLADYKHIGFRMLGFQTWLCCLLAA